MDSFVSREVMSVYDKNNDKGPKNNTGKGQNLTVKEGSCTLKVRCIEAQILFRFISFPLKIDGELF